MEDALPYEGPPPPYNEVQTSQNSAIASGGQFILQSISDRQELVNDHTQLQSSNIPQLDGPSEGTKPYISAATSP